MHPEILVVSLKESADRQASIARQLDKCGLSFSFFYGVDGRKEYSEVDAFYSDKLRRFFRGQPLSRGQIGCFGSHYRIWVKCFTERKPVIVLEDDAKIIEDRFLKFCEVARRIPDQFECVRLFDREVKRKVGLLVGSVGEFNFFKYTKGLMGTGGYYLSPTGAHKLIKHVSPIFYPVDIYMERFWSHGVECYGVDPVCIEMSEEFESTIGYPDQKRGRPFFVKVRREVFNASEKGRRALHNTLFRLGLILGP